jgi:hypothetical protein
MTAGHDLDRRRLVRGLATAAGLIPALVLAGRAAAEPANGKPDVKFQNTPKGADRCADCVSFIPGATSGAPGTCKAVQGVIPQNGWCVLYVRRKA